MITIALVVSLILVMTISGFLVWNQSNKNQVLGDFIIEANTKARTTYRMMKEIDSEGAFESDDEVGAVFESLLATVQEYSEFMNIYLIEVDDDAVVVEGDE